MSELKELLIDAYQTDGVMGEGEAMRITVDTSIKTIIKWLNKERAKARVHNEARNAALARMIIELKGEL
jgi:hypothetical protein